VATTFKEGRNLKQALYKPSVARATPVARCCSTEASTSTFVLFREVMLNCTL
jgi:hypothetical protein